MQKTRKKAPRNPWRDDVTQSREDNIAALIIEAAEDPEQRLFGRKLFVDPARDERPGYYKLVGQTRVVRAPIASGFDRYVKPPRPGVRAKYRVPARHHLGRMQSRWRTDNVVPDGAKLIEDAERDAWFAFAAEMLARYAEHPQPRIEHNGLAIEAFPEHSGIYVEVPDPSGLLVVVCLRAESWAPYRGVQRLDRAKVEAHADGAGHWLTACIQDAKAGAPQDTDGALFALTEAARHMQALSDAVYYTKASGRQFWFPLHDPDALRTAWWFTASQRAAT